MSPMKNKGQVFLVALVTFLFVGCQYASRESSRALLFEKLEKAVITEQHVDEAASIEAELAKTYRTPRPRVSVGLELSLALLGSLLWPGTRRPTCARGSRSPRTVAPVPLRSC